MCLILSYHFDLSVGIGSQSIQGNADGSAGTSSQGKEKISNFVLLLMCERTWFIFMFVNLDHVKCWCTKDTTLYNNRALNIGKLVCVCGALTLIALSTYINKRLMNNVLFRLTLCHFIQSVTAADSVMCTNMYMCYLRLSAARFEKVLW
jgi:hypothetical protein